MPRRVLLMISSLRRGGSEQQVLLLLRHLDRQRFAPELYVTARVGDLRSAIPADVPLHSHEDAAKLGGVYVPGRALRHQGRYLTSLLREREIDVIYDRTFQMSIIAGPAAVAAGIPRVSTIVSPPDLAVPAVANRFVWLKRRRLAVAYRQSRHVVAVSQQTASAAEAFYRLPADLVKVVPNPVDIQQLRADVRGTSFVRDDRLTLVCVGRMTAEKGHRDLVAAMESVDATWRDEWPGIRLLLIGNGPLRADLEARWSAQPHRHQIEFLGVQANPAAYIAAADGLVLPSHFEGMPNVVLEAMALETPVIATRCGGTVELERDQPTILWAEPKCPASLASALEKFADDPASRLARVRHGKRLVEEHHDVVKTTRRIEELLQ